MKHALLIALVATASPALAEGEMSAGTELAEASRVTILPGFRRGDAILAGIRIDLAPGWKTYWRSPGETGIAPIFDWSGSDNVAEVRVHWPVPEVIDSAGARTIGFSGHVVLPVEVVPRDPAAPVRLDLAMEYGICSDICVPAAARVGAPLGGGAEAEITAAMARMPITGAEAGLAAMECALTPAGRDYALTATMRFDGPLPDALAVVVESGSDLVWVSKSDHGASADTLTLEAELMYFGKDGGPAAQDLSITIIGSGSGVELGSCPKG